MRRPLVSIAITASVLAGSAVTATAARQEIVPGITYERVATDGQVIHITRVNRSP